MTPPTQDTRRELASRRNDGIEVTLWWDSGDDSVSIEVWHLATDETLTVRVPRGSALDAFEHPFAYLSAVPGDVALALHPAC